MEGSGFEQTPYLVRRADGQIVQLPALLYVLLEALVESASYDTIAERVTERVGAELDPEDARFVVDEKLRPLGLVARRRGAAAPAATPDDARPGNDLLALTWKARVVPERAVRAITTIFLPLFWPPLVALVVGGFLALCGWLFFSHGITQAVRTVLYQPSLLVLVFGGVVVATAFHEIGHATACRYGGARPGVLGVGLYVIWPVFYTDVTDSYRLGRAGRLRTDMGGIYFNSIFALGCGAAYLWTHWEPVLLLVLVQTFTIVQQLLPLGRLDGYLILTDLTGVPDLLSRIKPILRGIVPGRGKDERVRELKPWVRRTATAYVALLIPVLLFIFTMMAINAPRVFATAYDSLGVRWQAASAAFGHGAGLLGLGDLLQCGALVIPALGMAVTSVRVGRRLGGAALAWSAGAPLRRAIVVAATAGAVGSVAYTWAPNGDYRPIQPGERGTIESGVASLAHVTGGRPSLTAARAVQLGGAPFEMSRLHGGRRGGPGAQPGQQPGGTGTATVPATKRTGADTTDTTTTPGGTGTSTSPSGTGTTTSTNTTTTGAGTTSPSGTSTTGTDTGTTTTGTTTTTTSTDTTTSTTPTTTTTTTTTSTTPTTP